MRTQMTWKRKTAAATLVLLLALGAATLAVACSGDADGSGSVRLVDERESGAAEDTAAPSVMESPPADASAGDGAEAFAEEQAPLAEPISLADVPQVGPRVIQTASLTLAVDRGDFEEAIDRARTIAAGLGGFVTSSSASQGPDERLVRGTLVIRVPSRSYAQAMSQLARLGTVKGREEAGQDVSQQYVDLEARERHLEAVERQLLTFLGKTQTIADALVVQDRLNQVQLQLEEIRGQLRYLDDQTSFSTISLTVAERGTPAVTAKDDGGWRLGDAWEAAVDGFLKVIGGVFVGLATAGPVLAALAVAFLGWRIVRRRRRAGETPALPADPATR